MPELPEVTTTVKGLQKVLPGLIFTDVWTDLAKKKQPIKQFKNTIKNESFFLTFKKKIIGQKIIKVERRAKNILVHLSNSETILIHLKMTGHLLYGQYAKQVITNGKLRNTKWKPRGDSPLNDPYNRFIHVVFSLSNGKNLAFCDSRKFGKITLFSTSLLKENLKNIGPEPLDKSFTFLKFKKRLLTKPKGKIKTILMDQSIIAGIGNIYSDEMLWLSDISPESVINNIPDLALKKLYKNMKEILKKGIDLGGDSMSDYRNIYGLKGKFQNHHNVYKKNNSNCLKIKCHGIIIRKMINGRSAHFCNIHQKLYI